MKRIVLLSCGVFILTCQTCIVAAAAPVLPFNEGHLPPGGMAAWKWIQGDGDLSLNGSGQIVLTTTSPPQAGDNRVGATIDLGHHTCESFVLDISVDPASNVTGQGFDQLDCGVTVGLPDRNVNPDRFQPVHHGLSLNIRDLHNMADYGVFVQDKDLSLPVPVGRGTGNPRAFQRHDGFYRFRLLVTPLESGSRVRIYHTQFVTPDWEGVTPQRVTAGFVGFYARLGRHSGKSIETTLASLSLRPIEPELGRRQLTAAESVLYALNLDSPGLQAVKAAMKEEDVETATSLFCNYLRQRKNVTGPTVPTEPLTAKEQRIADLMTQDKIEVYTGGPLFEHTFDNPYDWAVDPYETGGQFGIYNSRMFPWLFMGRAYRATQDPKYPRTFVKQLNSWLNQIPLRIVATPGNPPFFIDGNTLEPPLLFTGNMGRRIELTWWQAYELFKHAPEFDDASLMRMMQYFQENARLVTNPSIFLPWDDSGLHMATGLLQCATMMPEWRESDRWKEIAFDRLEQTFRTQVHDDGTHASLSTGYGWATIDSYHNVFEIMKRNQQEIPQKFLAAIRGMIMGYMGILRPDFGNISLNDGGWGDVDELVRKSLPLFPDDPELAYFASRGAAGQPPSWTSRYFPNAGWYALRTGFGPREKMLFMDGGPFGASHGKQDALHLVVACGNSLLLRDGGRGDYTSKPTSRWTSQTLAFNTLTPDWASQDRTHRYEHEKYVGLNPPTRPWISNNNFDYGRSEYDAGWYRSGKQISGTHTRHAVFLKGRNPPETGYWIIVDQVTPKDQTVHTWRHPWHLSTEDVSVDRATQSFQTHGPDAQLKVLSIDPVDNVELTLVKGQADPVLQGWKVHGSESRPHVVPMHTWTSAGAFTKAWVLLPRHADQLTFEVNSVANIAVADGQLTFTLKRTDGGLDHIAVALDKQKKIFEQVPGHQVEGRLVVLRISRDGTRETMLNAN